MRIEHGRVALELHRLANGRGPALLLLHELFGSAHDWRAAAQPWPGPVYALDFCGHGQSGRVRGGAYFSELLLGDADSALARIGRAALVGRGIGAYVALLLAGCRREQVPAALLLPGRGLSGGGASPTFAPDAFAPYLLPDADAPDGADPRVRVLEVDVRPADYAERFGRAARRLLLLEDGGARPPWWAAIRGDAATAGADEGEAFRRLLDAARG
jgi:pimeloyl-ACP methyl ester carboxylesterase